MIGPSTVTSFFAIEDACILVNIDFFQEKFENVKKPAEVSIEGL